jgi:hypothetical protein
MFAYLTQLFLLGTFAIDGFILHLFGGKSAIGKKWAEKSSPALRRERNANRRGAISQKTNVTRNKVADTFCNRVQVKDWNCCWISTVDPLVSPFLCICGVSVQTIAPTPQDKFFILGRPQSIENGDEAVKTFEILGP